MKTQYEIESEAASRRGARILAMRRGKPIPNPELAGADARPGNADDAAVLALIRGVAKISGADCFPPAKQLAQKQRDLQREAGNGSVFAANEILAIGPLMSGVSYV